MANHDEDEDGEFGEEPEGHARKVVTLPNDNIGLVFSRVVRDIQSQITQDDMVVDVELNFKNLVAKKGGFLGIASKKTESTIEIKLATRIRKD